MWRFCNTVNNFSMDKKCAQLWQRLSAALKPQISADSFKRWFSTVELVEAKEKSITLTVPNNIYQLWIESNYMPALQNAIAVTFDGPRLVKFSGPSMAGRANVCGRFGHGERSVARASSGFATGHNCSGTQSAKYIRIVRRRPE